MSQNFSVSNANGWAEDPGNSLQQNQYSCSSCSRCTFSAYRGSSQYTRYFTKRINVVLVLSSYPVTISERTEVANVFSRNTYIFSTK